MEKSFSGYCRKLDSARIVLCEAEPGEPAEADCDYPACAYASGCPIGRELAAFLAESGQNNGERL